MAISATQIPLPPQIEGRGPTLATLHEIETILRHADGPISINEIKRRMRAKVVRHGKVRASIEEFKRFGFVVEGSRGVIWSLNVDPQAWKKSKSQRL